MKVRSTITKNQFGTIEMDIPDGVLEGAETAKAKKLRVKKYIEKHMTEGKITWSYPEPPYVERGYFEAG